MTSSGRVLGLLKGLTKLIEFETELFFFFFFKLVRRSYCNIVQGEDLGATITNQQKVSGICNNVG